MQELVLFRDNQEVTADDLSNIGVYGRKTIDRIGAEAISSGNHFVGFNTTLKTGLVVTMAPGAAWLSGKAYIDEAASDIDLQNSRPLANQRKVILAAHGQETDTDIEPRDYLINASTGQTQPQPVAMRRVRNAVIDIINGVDSADPQLPNVPAGSVAICVVTLDEEQILSIEMLTGNILPSIRGNHLRISELERWRGVVDPQISAILSVLADLRSRVGDAADKSTVAQLALDVSLLKEMSELPDEYVDYAADRYLTDDETDAGHAGYDARIEEGIRFPWAATEEASLKLLNPNEPLVRTVNNITLPSWVEVPRLTLNAYSGERSISQYNTYAHALKQMTTTRRRVRYGESKRVCTNSRWWKQGRYDSVSNTFSYQGETWEVQNAGELEAALARGKAQHVFVRVTRMFEDVYEEPYWEHDLVEITATGALVAQTFLNAQDGWLTSVNLKLTRIDAANNVEVMIAEANTIGAPDPVRVIARATLPGANAKQYQAATGGGKTNVPLPPTFLQAGRRYALILVTGGDYYTAITANGENVHGTFFSSTDGVFFQGDLINDMMFDLNFARFNATRIEVSLGWGVQNALQLTGGMTDIDILAEGIMPKSTRLDYQVQIGGVWQTFEPSDAPVLDAAPNLLPIRAVFNGTFDVMPSIRLDTSECRVARPKLAFTHFSEPRTLDAPCDLIEVSLWLEDFNDTPHNCTITIIPTGGSEETADSVEDSVPGPRALKRKASFSLGAPISEYVIKVVGSTNSLASSWLVSQRFDYAND